MSLSNIELPKALMEIRESAFYNSGLRNIVFNEGVERIEYLAFHQCDDLLEVWLPQNITYCSAAAFEKSTTKHTVADSKTAEEMTEKGIGHEEYHMLNDAKKLCFSLEEEGRDRMDLLSDPLLPKEAWEVVPIGADLFENGCKGTVTAIKPGATMLRIQKKGHPAVFWMVEAQAAAMHLESHMYFIKVGETLCELAMTISPCWIGPYEVMVETLDPLILKKQEDGQFTGEKEGLTKVKVTIRCKDGFELMDLAYVRVEKKNKLMRGIGR